MGLFDGGGFSQQDQMLLGLAQGLLSAKGGAGLSAGLQGLLGAQDASQKRNIQQAQIDNYRSEIEARGLKAKQDQRMQDRIGSLFGDAAPSAGAEPAMSPGAFTPSAGMGPTMPITEMQQPKPQGQANLVQLAKELNIPIQALQTDMAFNGGKGIAAMLYKSGTPDMAVNNGYAYDKNKTGPGFLPFLNTSQSGQTSMGRIGPDGLPVVSAPQGAVDTFNAYNRASASVKPIKVYNPQTQREEFSNEADVAQPQSTAPAGGTGYGTEAQMRGTVQGMGNAPGELQRELAQTQADLTRVTDPSSRQQLQAHLADIQGRMALAGQGGGRASAGPSAAEATQQAADKAKIVKQAEVDVMPTAQRQSSIASGNYLTQIIDKALKHPGLSTATGLQGTLDPRNYIAGTNATDFRKVLDQVGGSAFLQAFEALKGGGAISEIEGTKGTAALARLDRAQSTKEFKSALNDFRSVVQNGLLRAKGNMRAQTGATGDFSGDNSEPLPGLEPNGKTSSMSTGGWSATLKK